MLLPPAEDVVSRVISHLLARNDAGIANDMFDRHTDSTLLAVTKRMQENADGSWQPIERVWLQGLRQRCERVLREGVLENLKSTRGLATMADALGHDRKKVLNVGPLPWSIVLNSARDDVQGEQRHMLFAFLMALVLYSPQPGVEPIFERTFEELHSALAASQLSDGASNLLSRYLPSVGWRDQWDYCLRLRIGVVEAYQRAGLDQQSFQRLSSDPWLMGQLQRVRNEKRRDWESYD
jgi:hypothetical protein